MDDPCLLQASESRNHGNAENAANRGSLPFKKRKLLCNYEVSGSSVELDKILFSDQRASTHEEKEAALTLLAAASGVLSNNLPPETIPLKLESTIENTEDTGTRSTTPINGITTMSNISAPTPKNDFVHSPVAITPSTVDWIDSALSNESSSQRPVRVHHPPLTAPLPNGCHGRTSRNNSYCRRMPCYNGSEYCKLHYQQYVVAGTRNVESEAMSHSPGTSNPASTYMDKRFTGCHDEIRCSATTTRGRECAYVCVQGTKYCHLHAEYDTNPPPRRGGSTSGVKGSQKSQSRPMTCVILPNWKDCPSIPDLDSDKQFALQPFMDSSFGKYDTCRRSPLSISSDDTTAYDEQRSDYFSNEKLLSSISTDQWFGRKVKVAIGPFMNRIGFVERWGNGWVTVRIHENLIHNRRSVELILVPSECNDDELVAKMTNPPSLEIPSVSYEIPEAESRHSPSYASPWDYQAQSLPSMAASGAHATNCNLDLGRRFPSNIVRPMPTHHFDIYQRTHAKQNQPSISH
jgi:hypothetical protein